MVYQKAFFPMDVVNIVQGYGVKSKTHKLSFALNLKGKYVIWAPFDCKITKVYRPKNMYESVSTIWLTSKQKVLSPNGCCGYLTVSITCFGKITKLEKGQQFCQGDYLFKNVNGQIHLEVACGKIAGWEKKTALDYTEYVIKNAVRAEDFLFLKKKTFVKNVIYKGKKYIFVKES